MNIAADDVLRLQMQGGTKTARGSALGVPASDAPRRSKKTPFRAGKYLFLPRKGKDRYVGSLAKSVEVPRKFDLDRALRQIRQAFHEELEKPVAKALRTDGRRPSLDLTFRIAQTMPAAVFLSSSLSSGARA